MTDDNCGTTRGRNWLAGAVCAGLLVIFAIISYTASQEKAAIFDEPMHLVAGYTRWPTLDFRMNPEDPALFGFLAGLPLSRGDLKLDLDSPLWQKMPEDFSATQWIFSMNALYRTAGVDADRLIQKSRMVFILVAVLLGGLVTWWSWRLAGAMSAVIAAALFAFDPNFIGHAALVKNDVLFSLCFIGMAMGLWRFGQRGTWLSLAAVAVACGAAVNVKFSGLLCGPIIFLTLLARAAIPRPWIVMGISLDLWWQRMIVVPGACAVIGLASYFAIWACYGFRYAPTNKPDVLLNTKQWVWQVKKNRAWEGSKTNFTISDEQIERQSPGATVNIMSWVESHQLLPQSWTHGFMYTYATTIRRDSYLMGEYSPLGWWYYFPCAAIFKTPVATLLTIGLAVVAAAAVLIIRAKSINKIDAWPILAIAVPLLFYGISTLTTAMNIGLRHILPMYPLIFVATAVSIAKLAQRWRLAGGIAVGVLLLGTAIETLAAYPNYLAFFNFPSAVSRDGYPGSFSLLGDSNLDWGQDLKLLAMWQKEHPFKKMYLNYFGTADPRYYGILASHMHLGWRFAESMDAPRVGEPCYLAISATNLQGVFYNETARREYQQLLDYYPAAILGGGTIYIFELPPSPQAHRKR